MNENMNNLIRKYYTLNKAIKITTMYASYVGYINRYDTIYLDLKTNDAQIKNITIPIKMIDTLELAN